MNKKKLVMLLICLFLYRYARSQNNSGQIIYTQKVTRDDRMFEKPLSNKRGLLTLTNDSLIFQCKKAKLSEFNFSIPYTQIQYIKPLYTFLFPNRIKIRTKNGKSYRLFTYKKRHILRITREKMKSI